jgi:hypothetical protein
MARPMGGSLFINILGALCLTWLLIRVHLPYGGRVLAATAAGVFAGVVADLPAWNWWGFSTPTPSSPLWIACSAGWWRVGHRLGD